MLLNFFCAVVVYRFRLSARRMIPKLNGAPIWLVSIALALVCAKVQARGSTLAVAPCRDTDRAGSGGWSLYCRCRW